MARLLWYQTRYQGIRALGWNLANWLVTQILSSILSLRILESLIQCWLEWPCNKSFSSVSDCIYIRRPVHTILAHGKHTWSLVTYTWLKCTTRSSQRSLTWPDASFILECTYQIKFNWKPSRLAWSQLTTMHCTEPCDLPRVFTFCVVALKSRQ